MTFIFIKHILSNHKRDPNIQLFTCLSVVMIVNNCGQTLRWPLYWKNFAQVVTIFSYTKEYYEHAVWGPASFQCCC